MKLLMEYGCKGYETEEEIEIDLTEEQRAKYKETGELPEELHEECMQSVYEVSDLFYILKKI